MVECAEEPGIIFYSTLTQPADFDAFEHLLTEVQTAYGREDVAALRSRVTPEMLSYYSEEFAQNASRGVINKIDNVKLLQGDLSEAWRESDDEYATVAMRYSLEDSMVDRSSGRVAQIEPSEARELWTFRRARGTRMNVKCLFPGNEGWEPGVVHLVFDGTHGAIVCQMEAKTRCVRDIKNPFKNCPL